MKGLKNFRLVFEVSFISFLSLYECLVFSSTHVPVWLKQNHSVWEWMPPTKSGSQAFRHQAVGKLVWDKQRQAAIEPQTHSSIAAGFQWERFKTKSWFMCKTWISIKRSTVRMSVSCTWLKASWYPFYFTWTKIKLMLPENLIYTYQYFY